MLDNKRCKDCGHLEKPYHDYPNIIGCGYVYKGGTVNVCFCSCKKFVD